MTIQTNEIVENVLNSIDPNSFRAQVLGTALKFKANWVELGERLTRVATEKIYEDWGYKNFEDYCRLEIKVKKSTAIKLTNAWFFLQAEEPQLLQQETTLDSLPDLDAVQVLQKARSNENWTPEMYGQLKESAIEKKQSAATVARKYKEMNKVLEIERTGKDTTLSKETNAQLKKLEKNLKNFDDVPEKFLTYLEEIEGYLQSLIKE
ncbi:MAG: hypothetical protein ACI86H_001221 [bacterium]|jgi:hypothetical protein